VDYEFYWILKDGQPVPEPDVIKWAEWMKVADRKVAKTDMTTALGRFHVSTIFLGFNHNFVDDGPPILFETAVFDRTGGVNFRPIEMRRYATLDEALAGHEEVVGEVARLKIWPDRDCVEEPEHGL